MLRNFLRGFGEHPRNLLAALVVTTAHTTLVKLLFGVQLPIAAGLDASSLDADSGGVRGAGGPVHDLQGLKVETVQVNSCNMGNEWIPECPDPRNSLFTALWLGRTEKRDLNTKTVSRWGRFLNLHLNHY